MVLKSRKIAVVLVGIMRVIMRGLLFLEQVVVLKPKSQFGRYSRSGILALVSSQPFTSVNGPFLDQRIFGTLESQH